MDLSNAKMMKLDTYEADILIEKDFLSKFNWKPSLILDNTRAEWEKLELKESGNNRVTELHRFNKKSPFKN